MNPNEFCDWLNEYIKSPLMSIDIIKERLKCVVVPKKALFGYRIDTECADFAQLNKDTIAGKETPLQNSHLFKEVGDISIDKTEDKVVRESCRYTG